MNPEFQRHLYLEFSLTRLIAMPLFLATVFALTYLIDNHIERDASGRLAVTMATAIGLFVVIVVFWGARQTAESVFEELRNKTWDIQKTSALSPWSLAWGKWLGSTVFNWYGGVICLMIYAAANPKPDEILVDGMMLLAGGVFAQGLSLFFTLLALRKKQSVKSSFTSLLILIGLIWFAQIFAYGIGHKSDLFGWYRFSLSVKTFLAISLVLACGWIGVGVYRLFAQELQVRTLPWVWLAFIAFLVIYGNGLAAGFVAGTNAFADFVGSGALLTLFFCAVFSYAQLLLDQNSPMLPRRIWLYAEQRQWRRLGEEVPCWLVNIALALIAVLLLAAEGEDAIGLEKHSLTAAYLLLLRDTALILFFSYAPDPKRALGLSLLWLALLYGILPSLFYSMELKLLATFTCPLYGGDTFIANFSAAVQLVIAIYLLIQRWQKTVMRIDLA